MSKTKNIFFVLLKMNTFEMSYLNRLTVFSGRNDIPS